MPDTLKQLFSNDKADELIEAIKQGSDAVQFKKIQDLTDVQKLTARTNIGAVSQNDVDSQVVKYNQAQNLTDVQKLTARSNIGAASQSDLNALAAVRYDQAQSLTDEQKQQARDNIGAGEVDATLSVEGMAADAKKTGDELSTLKEDLYSIENLNSITMYKHQFITNEGKTSSNSKTARTALFTGSPLRKTISIDSEEYIVKISYFSSNGSVGTGEGYLGESIFTNVDLNIPKESEIIGLSFKRTDDASISDSDIINIKNALKATTIVDTSLTLEGVPADSKAVHDSLEQKASLSQIEGITTKIDDADSEIKSLQDIIDGAEFYTVKPILEGPGAVRATDGGLGQTASIGHTEYVYVHGFNYIKYEQVVETGATTNFGIAFYDSGKNYLKGKNNLTNGASLSYENALVIVPANAYYVRFTYLVNTEEYGEFKIELNSQLHKAYTDIENIKSVLNGNKLITLPAVYIISGQYMNYSNGIAYYNDSYSIAHMIPISGISKLFYKKIGLSASNPVIGIAFYGLDMKYISGISAEGDKTDTNYIGYTYADIPSNAAYVSVTFFSDTVTYGDADIYGSYDSSSETNYENITNKFVSNGYITTNVGKGNAVSIKDVTLNGTTSHLVEPCKFGDIFYIRCRAGSIGLPWCFIDNAYNVVSASGPNISIDTYITAPCSGYLIVNAYTQQFRCVFKSTDNIKIRKFYFPSGATPKYYYPDITIPISSVIPNTEEVEPSTVYELYDNLMDSYPDLITKEELPYKDASGTYSIYLYTFEAKDSIYQWSQTYKPPKKPVLIIGSGLHGCGNSGDDHTMIGTLYLFLKDMCDKWRKNESLSYIRNNFVLKIIPLQNPWGQKNKNRQNSNAIDINRNMSFGWYLREDISNPAYGGPSPISENESKNLAYVLDNTKNVCLYIDLHARIGEVAQSRLAYISLWQMSGIIRILNDILYDISRTWRTMTNDLTDINVYGFIENDSNPAGTVGSYPYTNGFLGLIYEGFSTFTGYTGTPYDETITKMNMFYFGTVLLRLLDYIKTDNSLMLPLLDD